ncbi:MAG TPA: cytochrome c3 family protein [Gemmatimonadales bacterium]
MRSASSHTEIPKLRWSTLLLTVPLAALLAGCTSDKVVFRDRDPFNEPVAAAAGFLGYFSTEEKQTTCGNCHAGHQASWRQTAHAGAYAALPPTATAACKKCHSVNGNGNDITVAAGYESTQDSIYHDVQCESCHGPGLTHVRGVGQGTIIRPLARVTVPGKGTCADCHSGSHTPFAEEWAQSGHSKVSASRAGNAECKSCHDGRGALVAWGVSSNYIERDVATAYQPTTCSVCHDPHGSPNTKQLRFSISSSDPEQNLCMKCHMRRVEPQVDASASPHAPQGALLLGTAGYRPAGFVYAEGRIFSSHATDANPRLCAGCHVNRLTITDPQGGFLSQATGHLFRPIPCLDPQGIPTGDKTCAYTSAARTWASCAKSGCHASADVAASAFGTVRARMKSLVDQLWINTDGDNTLDAAPTDAGMLATLKQTRATEWSTTDGRITPAEGAEFNARLCGETGQSNSDNSKGIHNPFLCEALLIATIAEVHTFYGLPAPPPAVQAIMDGPVGGSFAKNMKVSYTQIPGYEIRPAGAKK